MNWREAHLRLSSTLPSSYHPFSPRETQIPKVKLRKSGVIVKGREYSTLRECCQNLKISPRTLYDWLNDGRARYVNG